MSALEVEASVRYCEHLLYVQRSQRSMLCTLSQQFQQLQGCCDVVKGCDKGCLVPQVSPLSLTLPYPLPYFYSLTYAINSQAQVPARYVQQQPAVSPVVCPPQYPLCYAEQSICHT